MPTLTGNIPRDLHDTVLAYADEHGVTVSSVIQAGLAALLALQPPEYLAHLKARGRMGRPPKRIGG